MLVKNCGELLTFEHTLTEMAKTSSHTQSNATKMERNERPRLLLGLLWQ